MKRNSCVCRKNDEQLWYQSIMNNVLLLFLEMQCCVILQVTVIYSPHTNGRFKEEQHVGEDQCDRQAVNSN